MVKVVFIKDPLFELDYQTLIDAKRREASSIEQKVQGAASKPFEWVGFIFGAVIQSGRTTLKYAWPSFKYTVLGYKGSWFDVELIDDLYLIGFKVILWALKMTWSFAETTLYLCVQPIISLPTASLAQYAEEGIDLSHFRTKDLSIDVSHVTDDVQIDMLQSFFDKIEWKDTTSLHYMQLSSCKEGKKIYTTQELKNGLALFIQNVKGRVPRIGTPPANKPELLMRFYQQIEDALRFSIDKVNKEMKDFQRMHGRDETHYSDTVRNQYKNFFENQARIAIDMAIAGDFCGTRYAEEATSTYLRYQGEIIEGETLEGHLIELLARKRLKIAEAEVSVMGKRNVHFYTRYFQTFGKLLALPGTGNVIEHIGREIDLDICLTSFFNKYTVNCIIDTVQENVKKSRKFRTQILDWLQDQMGDWEKDKDNEEANTCIAKITKILELSEDRQPFSEPTTDLNTNKGEYPTEKCDIKNKKIQGICDIKNKKIQGIKELLPELNTTTCESIIQKPLSAREAVENALQMRRRLKFLHYLLHNNMDKNAEKIKDDDLCSEEALGTLEAYIDEHGFSREILEWLLVSHNILLPQEVPG